MGNRGNYKGTGTFKTDGRGGHALVVGGSLAGLLAARVLSRHFERVTVVERDTFTDTAEARRGVPQARHVHALMLRGRMIVEELFPGLQAEMVAAGAPLIDMGREVAWLSPAGWGVRFHSDLPVLAFTRPLLDLHVRRRVAADSRVRILENTDVVRLVPDERNRGVAGAILRARSSGQGEAAGEEVLRADLLVDAAGRGSRAPQWLEELGYPAPQEIVVNSFRGYASRLYRIPAGRDADWRCVFLQAAPPEGKRGGILFPVEGDRWLLTLIGAARDYPPTDEAGFLEYARSLRSPVIRDAIRDAEPLSPIASFRATENRLRRFERTERAPENFVAVGDSACAFNPVYGQGMTVAALGAMALDETLREQKRLRPGRGLDDLARRFQKRLAKVNSAPWMLATSEDFRYRETVGGRPTLATRFMHAYMDRVVSLSTRDARVRRRLLENFHMLRRPASLFSPFIMLRVLRQSLGIAPRPVRTEPTPAVNSAPLFDTSGRD